MKAKNPKLVVGLGNPGEEYSDTRHNIGFIIVKSVCRELNTPPFKKKCAAIFSKTNDAVLALPITYMNRSGVAVKCFLNKFNIPVEDILVVVDDLELPLGKIRLRDSGSSGGHNGLKSIIKEIGTNDFKRLRFGIAAANTSTRKYLDTKEFVLSPFEDDEFSIVKKKTPVAVNLIKIFLNEDYQSVLDYNSKINSLSQD